jgi:hypothetical protein
MCSRAATSRTLPAFSVREAAVTLAGGGPHAQPRTGSPRGPAPRGKGDFRSLEALFGQTYPDDLGCGGGQCVEPSAAGCCREGPTMTVAKRLKARIRARMARTGER